jgi:hypothetical protein
MINYNTVKNIEAFWLIKYSFKIINYYKTNNRMFYIQISQGKMIKNLKKMISIRGVQTFSKNNSC